MPRAMAARSPIEETAGPAEMSRSPRSASCSAVLQATGHVRCPRPESGRERDGVDRLAKLPQLSEPRPAPDVPERHLAGRGAGHKMAPRIERQAADGSADGLDLLPVTHVEDERFFAPGRRQPTVRAEGEARDAGATVAELGDERTALRIPDPRQGTGGVHRGHEPSVGRDRAAVEVRRCLAALCLEVVKQRAASSVPDPDHRFGDGHEPGAVGAVDDLIDLGAVREHQEVAIGLPIPDLRGAIVGRGDLTAVRREGRPPHAAMRAREACLLREAGLHRARKHECRRRRRVPLVRLRLGDPRSRDFVLRAGLLFRKARLLFGKMCTVGEHDKGTRRRHRRHQLRAHMARKQAVIAAVTMVGGCRPGTVGSWLQDRRTDRICGTFPDARMFLVMSETETTTTRADAMGPNGWSVRDEVTQLREWRTDIAYPLPPKQVVSTIGASKDCWLRLWHPSRSISRTHAVLAHGNGGWLLSDLESKNGMYLDGVRMSALSVVPGAEIRIGETTLVAESPKLIALRALLERFFGWADERREDVDRALFLGAELALRWQSRLRSRRAYRRNHEAREQLGAARTDPRIDRGVDRPGRCRARRRGGQGRRAAAAARRRSQGGIRALPAAERPRGDPGAGSGRAAGRGQRLVPRRLGLRGAGQERLRAPVRAHDVPGLEARRRGQALRDPEEHRGRERQRHDQHRSHQLL
ncbi:MAG: FHA domain-containing protein [Deltaproteobacteria bacterium]|nr:MAG: FHA domain-containing protein [Deltaproteobacteria bacterium]